MKIKNESEPIVSTRDSSEVTSDKKDNINTWNIDEHIYQDKLIQETKQFDGNTVLLDSTNNNYTNTVLLDLTKNNYTLLEKFVYDTARFHLSRLNIHNMENHYVEFWCKSKFDTHALHVDCDESLKMKGEYDYPLLSCVTYLNDVTGCPTIITNVDMDSYKYKEFESQTELILSLPVHNKQITFDGSFFHGSTTLDDTQHMDERYIIAINFWKTKPHNIEYYKPNADSEPDNKSSFVRDKPIINLREDTTDICSVNVCNDTINYNLFTRHTQRLYPNPAFSTQR